MSLSLNFEPHSWYMGFAIEDNRGYKNGILCTWLAYIDNDDTYECDRVAASTLDILKQRIREYYIIKSGGDFNKVPAHLVKPLALHVTRTKIPF